MQCVFFFFNYFIKYLVGNFTLALTDLAEAAKATVLGSKMNMLTREASRCASAEVIQLGHHLQICSRLTPTHCHACHHHRNPHIIKELLSLTCVSEGGQAGEGKNLLTSSADLHVHIHQHL